MSQHCLENKREEGARREGAREGGEEASLSGSAAHGVSRNLNLNRGQSLQRYIKGIKGTKQRLIPGKVGPIPHTKKSLFFTLL